MRQMRERETDRTSEKKRHSDREKHKNINRNKQSDTLIEQAKATLGITSRL